MFRAVLFVTAQAWKQPRYPPGEWVCKPCHVHPTECEKVARITLCCTGATAWTGRTIVSLRCRRAHPVRVRLHRILEHANEFITAESKAVRLGVGGGYRGRRRRLRAMNEFAISAVVMVPWGCTHARTQQIVHLNMSRCVRQLIPNQDEKRQNGKRGIRNPKSRQLSQCVLLQREAEK